MGGETLLQDPLLFEQVLATNYSYTRNMCLLACSQMYTTAKCGCNNYKIPMPVSGYEFCLSDEERECAHNAYYFDFIAGDYIALNCLPKCPLECYQRQIAASFSYFQFPSQTQVNTTRNNPYFAAKFANQTDFTDFGSDYDLLSNILISLSIYYESLAYMLEEEKAEYTVDDLIGSIGGYMHLFLGMSAFSLVQILELAAYCIIYLAIPKRVQ